MLKLLILATFANCLAWIAIVPIWQYPDEQAHYAQVQYYSRFGYNTSLSLSPNTSEEIVMSEKILGTERNSFGNNKFTYNPNYNYLYSENTKGFYEDHISNIAGGKTPNFIKQEATSNPPLYYFLASLVNKLFSNEDLFVRVNAVRVFSAAIMVLTVVVSYKISLTLFKENLYLKYILPLAVGFNPMFVFVSTGVLPDPLTNLLFTTVILIAVNIIRTSFNVKHLAEFLAVSSLGLLTRQQFILALPIFLSSLLFKTQKSLKQIIVLIISVVSLLSVITFNTFVSKLPLISELRIPEANFFNVEVLNSEKLNEYAKLSASTYYHQTFAWYWGVYRWLSLTLPAHYYSIIKLLVLVSVIGLALKFMAFFKNRRKPETKYTIFLVTSTLLYLTAMFVGDLFFYSNRGYSFGIQGRYFFPLIVAHLALMIIGLNEVFSKFSNQHKKYCYTVLVAALLVFNNFSLLHVARSYYSLESLSGFIIQASQYKPEIFKGLNLALVILCAASLQVILFAKFLKVIYKKTDDQSS